MTLRQRTPVSPHEPPPTGSGPVRDAPSEESILARIRSEFDEMRGFSPTLMQAARLFDLPVDECERVLNDLVREGFLRCAPDTTYRLAAE